MSGLHPIQRRWHAEDLVRLRHAGEARRHIASQRAGQVDPNPHQIDAVVFALTRIATGGCILADEVGLGKTIEAGLVMSQLRAEGRSRILLITPKPLVGQWREELSALFGIEVREGGRTTEDFSGPGVFLVGREFAGGPKGSDALVGSGAFDLAVIDEAHEMFAGIYRRYDPSGGVRTGARYAKTAARIKALLEGTPVLLLTATPIQNTLTELWGLVQYIEPTGTLLGDLGTFRTLFCDGDDRALAVGQGDELRRRLAEVCQRTLRRQAQAFMQKKFVRRSARTFGYTMSPGERALYDDVTAYLLEPDLCAFGGGNRRLLLLAFHRRMASSLRALAESLEAVARRLDRRLTAHDEGTLELFPDDPHEDLDDDPAEPTEPGPGDDALSQPVARVRAERDRVLALAARARALPVDSKAVALLDAVRFVFERHRAGEGTGKVVIFTEALSTQAYLRELLEASGLAQRGEITEFRGENRGPRASEALRRWDDEIGSRMPEHRRPSPQVAIRLALVHEFATTTKVFISTEAGAKGLNLQFCENVVNYDLPWNPQRIEQRIGRCHRYGQTRDVTVLNLIATDNAAQTLTFEILSRKLELFGDVLDASDAVLYEARGGSEALVSVVAGSIEDELARVYEQARDPEQVREGIARLGAWVDDARESLEQSRARTSGLIETRFDETVRRAFAQLDERVPQDLAEFDRDLERVVGGLFDALGVPWTSEGDRERRGLTFSGDTRLPDGFRGGGRVVVGTAAPGEDRLHLGHPLVEAAVQEARSSTAGRVFRVRAGGLGGSRSERFASLVVLEVHYPGYDPSVELVPVVLEPGGVPWSREDAEAFLEAQIEDHPGVSGAGPPAEALEDAIDEVLFLAQGEVEARQDRRFRDSLERIERHVDDRILVASRRRSELRSLLAEAQRVRDGAVGSGPRTRAEEECASLQQEIDEISAEIARLQRRDDETYQQWWAHAHAQRYAAPRWGRIIEAEIELR